MDQKTFVRSKTKWNVPYKFFNNSLSRGIVGSMLSLTARWVSYMPAARSGIRVLNILFCKNKCKFRFLVLNLKQSYATAWHCKEELHKIFRTASKVKATRASNVYSMVQPEKTLIGETRFEIGLRFGSWNPKTVQCREHTQRTAFWETVWSTSAQIYRWLDWCPRPTLLVDKSYWCLCPRERNAWNVWKCGPWFRWENYL